VVVVFDADRAGEMASLRSLDLLIEEDVHVRIASLAKNEDPDSMIRKHGKESFGKKITEAADLFEYKLALLGQSHSLETVEGKVNIAAQMLPTINRVTNAIRRSSYVKKLAQEFSRGETSLGEEWILAELKKVKKDFRNLAAPDPVRSEIKAKRPAEEMLLKITLDAAEEALVEIKKHLSLEDFQDIRIREAMRVVLRMHEQGEPIQEGRLINCLASEEAATFIARVCSCEKEYDDVHRCLIDCISRIKADNLKDILHRLQREIKLAQGWGHKDKVLELMGKYNSLIKRQDKKDEPRPSKTGNA
jgi:DNA primase